MNDLNNMEKMNQTNECKLTAGFWPINLRFDGARATDDAAAAATTRILKKSWPVQVIQSDCK